MKKSILPILAIILALGLALPMTLPVAAGPTGNLLQNPGAENGDTSGWTVNGYPAAIQSIEESCGWVYPNSDDWFFGMGPNGGILVAWMEQTIDLTSHGGTPVTFQAGGWVQTEKYWMPADGWPDSGDPGYYDCGGLVIEFFDEWGGSLVTFELEPADPEGGVWTGAVENPCCECDPINIPHTYAEFSISGEVPEGAATAVYTLKGYRVWSVYINTFYDDLFFTLNIAQPTPEPTPEPTPTPTVTVTPPPSVGGTTLPTDKLGLMMPWIIAAGALIVIGGASLAIWNRKRGTEGAADR
jgi:hypothetical protein